MRSTGYIRHVNYTDTCLNYDVIYIAGFITQSSGKRHQLSDGERSVKKIAESEGCILWLP